MTVESIKRAIESLPADERQSLAQWLNELAYDEWDRQMVADFSPGGRGAALVERVKREVAEGRTVDSAGVRAVPTLRGQCAPD